MEGPVYAETVTYSFIATGRWKPATGPVGQMVTSVGQMNFITNELELAKDPINCQLSVSAIGLRYYFMTHAILEQQY